jgi:transposase
MVDNSLFLWYHLLQQGEVSMAQRPYDTVQNMLFVPHQALPEDHLCFVFDEIVDELDFSFFPDKRSTPGEPQYDPRLMTKILLYGYSSGVFSSRKLMMACREHLPFMYLTRGQTPDFRTISDFRKNNLDFLSGAYVRVVRIAQRMGLVKLGVAAIDSMKVRANAAHKKMLSEERLLELRESVREEMRKAVALDESEDAKLGSAKTGQELPRHLRSQALRLKQIERALKSLEETGYQKASLTDPESSQMRNHGQVRPHYSCQITADAESRIIVAADVSRSPTDYAELEAQLDQAQSNTGHKPEKVVADNGYYTVENLAALEQRGVEAYIPSGPQARDAKLRAQGKEVPERPFEKSKFQYDEQRDVYICPLGKVLTRRGKGDAAGRVTYRGSECKDCPRKPECARKRALRSITRTANELAVETVRLRMESNEGKGVYQKRLSIEPIFAWMKWAGGFSRFRLRGKTGALKEFILLCTGHNIKQLAKHLKTMGPKDAKQRLHDAATLFLSSFSAFPRAFLVFAT